MVKMIGLGTTLMCSTAGSTTYGVTVGQLTSMSGPAASADDVETTALDSGSIFKTFAKGLVDLGEVSANMIWDGSNATHKAMHALLRNQTVAKWKLVFPTTTIFEEFDGYVKGVTREVSDPGSLITGTLTIKVTADSTATLPYTT